jgi:hypothetical protein
VTPARASVDLDQDLDAMFGSFRFRTPVSNITGWRIEGPFRWITAIGVRLGIPRLDLTFGGDTHGGVRVDFREPVQWGRLRIPAFYVTVDDLEGLGRELTRLGIPGHDARRAARR